MFIDKMEKYIIQNVLYILRGVRTGQPYKHPARTTLQENIRMKTPKMYYGVLFLFCILTLSIGMASASGSV